MDKKALVKEGYNKIAEKYLETRLEVVDVSDLLKEFASMIEEDAIVLDAGCGAGIPDSRFLSEKFDVIGIDISEKQIELAKQNVPKASFLVKDMTELDFPDNHFGGILANYSIIHVPRDEHEGLFRNLYRMLKPEGVALFSLHNDDDSCFINEDFFGAEMYWSGFDAESNVKLLKKIGFRIVWAKVIKDILGNEASHLFVLIMKAKE